MARAIDTGGGGDGSRQKQYLGVSAGYSPKVFRCQFFGAFCSGCAAPWGAHNALTSTRTPHWQISTLEMPSVSSAEVFTLPTGMQFFTLDSSKIEVFKTYFFDIATT